MRLPLDSHALHANELTLAVEAAPSLLARSVTSVLAGNISSLSQLPRPHHLTCDYASSLPTTAEQCQFVEQHDCSSSDSLVDYANLVFCVFGLEHRAVCCFMLVLMLFVYFIALGLIAEKYLCPNLLTLSKKLKMSETLAVS